MALFEKLLGSKKEKKIFSCLFLIPKKSTVLEISLIGHFIV